MAIVSNIDDAWQFIRENFEIQKKKADDTLQSWRPLKTLPNDLNKTAWALKWVPERWWKTNPDYSSWDSNITSAEQLLKRRDQLIQQLDQVLEICEPIWQENQQTVEHNAKVVEKIKFLMRSLGIPETYSERDFKSRARTPKYVTHRAGYLSDIGRTVPLQDVSKNQMQTTIKNKKEQIEKQYQTLIQTIRETERFKADEAKRIAREKFLASVKIKLELPWEANEEDILDAMLNRDRFLNLAHQMQMTRNEFDRGYKPILYALEKLDQSNSTEYQIFESLSSTCASWDGDGRIFRDCEWNYEKIFDLVDADLYTIYAEFQKF